MSESNPPASTIVFRKWRERMDWSRAAAAAELGVSVHTVKSYELGRRLVPDPIAKLMAGLERRKLDDVESVSRSPIRIVGGGALAPISPNIALCAPAYGQTARALLSIVKAHDRPAEMILTRMADPTSPHETVADLQALAETWAADRRCRVVFWSASTPAAWMTADHPLMMAPDAGRRIVSAFATRPDVTLVLFSPTRGASRDEQINAAMDLMAATSCALVLANDSATRTNLVLDEAGACLHESFDRDTALASLVAHAIGLSVRCPSPLKTTAVTA